MILNAEALEVLSYLKTCPGQFVAMGSISRRAGGRRRFEATPNWAKGLMGPLVEAGLLEMNERGHYRLKGTEAAVPGQPQAPRATQKVRGKVVGDDYFPAPEEQPVVGHARIRNHPRAVPRRSSKRGPAPNRALIGATSHGTMYCENPPIWTSSPLRRQIICTHRLSWRPSTRVFMSLPKNQCV